MYHFVTHLSTSEVASLTIYGILDVASGKVIAKMTDAHRAIEFISVLRTH
ncbi:hypothetical protein [Ferrithrix thermotolerans]|nr:hypothetical protein [Ferrithrix thermotolerans]